MSSSVGAVYAKAIFESAQEKGQLENVFRDLKAFQEALSGHSGLRSAMVEPSIDTQSRQAILADLAKSMGLGTLAANFLDLLAARRRMADLDKILAELEARVEGAQGVIAGTVRSAVALSAEELAVLSAALAKRVGGKVKLVPSVDTSLLGGVVATVAGKTFDASLKTQLARFRSELI